MAVVTFTPEFTIGDSVLRKCDSDKNKYIIIQYLVDHKDVMYKISGMDGVYVVYSFEIVDYAQRFADLN